MGEYLYEQLQTLYKHNIVGHIRGGLGLLAAIELVSDRFKKIPFDKKFNINKKLPKLLYKNNIVSFRAGDIISICPPLCISKDEIDFLINGLDESLLELSGIIGNK